MAIAPWNFPTYRACSNYNFGYDGDPYYTNSADLSAFDDGEITIILAVLFTPGHATSGYSQNSSGTNSSWPVIWGLSDIGRGDSAFALRPGYWNGGQYRILNFFLHNGSSYPTSFQLTPDDCLPAGINPEGQMLQVVISCSPSNGRRQIAVNGQLLVNLNGAAFGTPGGLSNARMGWHCYPNWNTTTWSAGGTGNELVSGPMAVHNTALDLSDPAVMANIYDDNGDFVFAGANGSNWFGGTQPFMYLPAGSPYGPDNGSNTLTWSRVSNTSYAKHGHPCGTKYDWPNEPTPQWLRAKDYPGLKGLWDISQLHDEQQYFIGNMITNGAHLRRYTTSYGAYPGPPMREGAIGQAVGGLTLGSQFGYKAYPTNGVLDAMCNGASKLWMTACLDWRWEPTANLGFQKLMGWRASSSTSIFGIYGTYPNLNGRTPVLQLKLGTGAAHYLGIGAIPANAAVRPLTCVFDEGVIKIFNGSGLTSTTDLSGTSTTLHATTTAFGILDYTSSASGNLRVGWDFLACGSGDVPTDQQIIDLHADLLNGAYT